MRKALCRQKVKDQSSEGKGGLQMKIILTGESILLLQELLIRETVFRKSHQLGYYLFIDVFVEHCVPSVMLFISYVEHSSKIRL
jgi:hypothetical protein